jgi:hypothetical protein
LPYFCRESEFFAEIAVNAVTRVKTVDAKGEAKYPINAINVLKAQGKSTKESQFIDGYALNCTVASQGITIDAAQLPMFVILNLFMFLCSHAQEDQERQDRSDRFQPHQAKVEHGRHREHHRSLQA